MALIMDAVNRVFCDFPGLAEVGDDGGTIQIVVDALGEKSLGRRFADGGEDSFYTFTGERCFGE